MRGQDSKRRKIRYNRIYTGGRCRACSAGKLTDRGFTLVELIIVVAVLSIIMALAAVGVNGYYETAKQMERSEVAETAFYALQSHVNYLKRHDALENYEAQMIAYNESVYGDKRILSEANNRTLVVSNYEGADKDSYYENEYYPAHEGSQIIYLTLDSAQSGGTGRENNPLYDVLQNALLNEETLTHSFLVEYDLTTGVVRSVFYSEYADRLSYDFSDLSGAASDQADCIWRGKTQIADKKQGYYGVMFTSREYTEVMNAVVAPEEVQLVNGDWLYVTWDEANANEEAFIDGTCDLDNLYYTIHVYREGDGGSGAKQEIATYEISRGDMYEERLAPSVAGVLSSIDDCNTGLINGKKVVLADTLDVDGTKKARIGYVDLEAAQNPERGVDELRYYLLLECLDHRFGDAGSGYTLDADDILSVTVDVTYKEPGGRTSNTASRESENKESAYFAYVRKDGLAEYGINCSRHLQNMEQGKYDGEYRLLANVDWANIEERGKTKNFEVVVFRDAVSGASHGLEGSFDGKMTEEDLNDFSEPSYFGSYEIQNLKIQDTSRELVGLFAVNNGRISNVILRNPDVTGTVKVGTIAGSNQGTSAQPAAISKVCVLNADVEGDYTVGGLVGLNSAYGTIDNCAVTTDMSATGTGKIAAWRELGGLVGVNEGAVQDISVGAKVQFLFPVESVAERSMRVLSTNLGAWIGGVIGRGAAGSTATNVINGVVLDGNAIPKNITAEGVQKVNEPLENMSASVVLGIKSVGGIVGGIDADAGEYSKLYNYGELHSVFLSDEQKNRRSANGTAYMKDFGGIAGSIETNAALEQCVTFTEVKLRYVSDFAETGTYAEIDAAAMLTYLGNNANHPYDIGGIAGRNSGLVKNCAALFKGYGTLEEEIVEQRKNMDETDGHFYTGYYVGGMVGLQDKGQLLFDAEAPIKDMQVSVEGYSIVGGLVGRQEAGAVGIFNTVGTEMTVSGTVAGKANTVIVNPYSVGGVVGDCMGGEISGAWTNHSNVFGYTGAGIAGYLAEGITLENCSNTGFIVGRGRSVSAASSHAGGIVAENHGEVKNCTNTGTVTTYYAKEVPADGGSKYAVNVGGVVGLNYGTVYNCHSGKNMDGTNYIAGNTLCWIGGVVGGNINSSAAGENGLVINTAEEEIVDVPIIVAKGAERLNGHYPFVGGIVGGSYMANGQTGSTFSLNNFTYQGTITSYSEVQVQTASYDYYYGTGGIVGVLFQSQELTDCKMTGKIIAPSQNYVGGIAGFMCGGRLTETNGVSSDAEITGYSYVGGIVGRALLLNHKAEYGAVVFDVKANYAQVAGVKYVGGLIGSAECFNNVQLDNRENHGAVTGSNDYVGGIVGNFSIKNSDITLKNYKNWKNDATVTGKSYVGGLVGNFASYYSASSNYVTDVFTVTDWINKGTITSNGVGGSNYIGGIIGSVGLYTTVSGCTNEGNVLPADRSQRVNCVGGIAGKVEKKCTFSSCSNKGEVTGYSNVGGILGSIDCTETVAALEFGNCTNEKTGIVVATRENAGGIAGYVRVNSPTSSKINFTVKTCKNHASLSAPHDLGGIAGYIQNTYYSIQSSTNDAVLGSDEWDAYDIGGIVGRSTHTRGKVVSEIKSCTNQNNIQNVSIAAVDTPAAGGIIGKTNQTLTLSSCVSGGALTAGYTAANSYAISANGSSSAMGGIIGWVADEGTTSETVIVKLQGCKNYMKLQATGNLQYAGGLIGRIGKMRVEIGLSGGLNSASYYCVNYGQIVSTGTMTNSGGIIGMAQNGTSLAMYGARSIVAATSSNDTYTLGLSAANMNNVGGLIGHVYNVQTLTVTGAYSTATGSYADSSRTIRSTGNVENIGGIIGNLENTKSAALKNLASTAKFDYRGDVTKHGGIVGSINNVTAVTLYNTDQNNTAGVVTTAAYNINRSGGIIGSIESSKVTLGTEGDTASGCENLGAVATLSAPASGRAWESGGIIGFVAGGTSVVAVNESTNSGAVYSFGYGADNGGIIGCIGYSASASVVNSRNMGVISSAGTAGKLGGIIGSADGVGDITVKGCVNGASGTTNGKIFCEGAETNCRYGGLIGFINNANTLTVSDASNYGQMTSGNGASPGRLGGIVGEANNVRTFTMNNVHNYANIGDNLNAVVMSGGLVGVLTADENSGRTTIFTDCDQNGNISKIQNNVGGLIGYHTGTSLRMENCVNNGALSVRHNETNNVGGLVGYTRVGSDDADTFISCRNYGTISMENGINRMYHIGGLVGYSEADMSFGEAQDATTYCSNAGDIKGYAGADFEHVGGAVGHLQNARADLYGFVNTGVIGEGAQNVKMTGGIVGFAMNSYVTMTDCTQSGRILQAKSDVGGLMGLSQGYDVTFTNCVNGVSDKADQKGFIATTGTEANNIAGLLGAMNASTKPDNTPGRTTITNSVNYGDIDAAAATYRIYHVGGMVGLMQSDLAIGEDDGSGDANCVNYGNITGASGMRIELAGGITGYLQHGEAILSFVENRGTIGDANTVLMHVGGIVGDIRNTSASIDHATNYASFTEKTAEQLGGIVGYTDNQQTAISNATNAATIINVGNVTDVGGIVGFSRNNQFSVKNAENRATINVGAGGDGNIGGIVGRDLTQFIVSNVQIVNCVNNAPILAGGKNNVGGIMGAHKAEQNGSKLEFVYCENNASINAANDGAGILPFVSADQGVVFFAYCGNYAPLTVSGEFAGGICADMNCDGGLLHCINTGAIVCGGARAGGLVGVMSIHKPYMIDCYDFGSVTAINYGWLVQLNNVGETNLIDCYVIPGALRIVAEGNQTIINQASSVYFSETVYNELRDLFGGDRAWTGDYKEDAKYLTSIYSYTPKEPNVSGFAYNTGDGTITWNITANGYLAVGGMELALYPADMEDADILADENGENAFLTLLCSFDNGRIPETGSVTVPPAKLPAEAGTYKLVMRNIGSSYVALNEDTEPVILAGNSARKLVAGETVSLPERPMLMMSFRMAMLPLAQLSEAEESEETDVEVTDEENVNPEELSNNSEETIGEDDGRLSVSGNDIEAVVDRKEDEEDADAVNPEDTGGDGDGEDDQDTADPVTDDGAEPDGEIEGSL